jgi:uncharacterized membrane protein YdbT with pleckstrin-like domain
MGYFEKTATAGEEIVASAKFSWLWLGLSVLPYLGGLISIYIVLHVLSDGFGMPLMPFFRYIMVICAFAAGAKYLKLALPWAFTEIAVTNKRLYYMHGFIARQSEEVAINRIQGVNLNQPFWGRIFDFGALSIFGYGIDQITLPPINDPLKFRRAIQEAIAEKESPDASYNS